MQDPDNQAAASDVNTAEIPEVSIVPAMRVIPELPPLPPVPTLPPSPPLGEFPRPDPPTFPELLPLSVMSPLEQLRATSTVDTEVQGVREFSPMPRTWGRPEAERTAECSQPPNQPTLHSPEEETFDFLKWRLSAQLECLLCIEIMMPPIMVCSNGHMICDNCRPKLERCPLCRGAITKRRNIFAEEVSTLLKVRCRYTNGGCLFVERPDKIEEHEDLCILQPVECLAGYGAQKVLKCGWKGKKCDLLGHVKKQHGLTMIQADQPIHFTSPCVYEQDYMHVALICAHAELFWLTLKFDVKNNKRFEAVHYIGSAVKAKEFQYRCDLLSGDGKTGTSFFSITRSIFEDTDDAFASNPHFQMGIDVFKKLFVEKDGHVTGYKLTIGKVRQSEI